MCLQVATKLVFVIFYHFQFPRFLSMVDYLMYFCTYLYGENGFLKPSFVASAMERYTHPNRLHTLPLYLSFVLASLINSISTCLGRCLFNNILVTLSHSHFLIVVSWTTSLDFYSLSKAQWCISPQYLPCFDPFLHW